MPCAETVVGWQRKTSGLDKALALVNMYAILHDFLVHFRVVLTYSENNNALAQKGLGSAPTFWASPVGHGT